MPKNKSHKGLLKRIRLTKTGKIKMYRAFGRHLKSHKRGKTVRSYRSSIYAKSGDMKKLSALLFRPVRSHEESVATRKLAAAKADQTS